MSDSKLSMLESIVRIIATIAVPVVLTLFGYIIQSEIAKNSVRKDYVQIAVNILSTEKNNDNADLHVWAARLLNEQSPTKFQKNELTSLQNIGLVKMSPPESLMVPPQEYELLTEGMTLKEATPIITSNNIKAAENREKLILWQEWAKSVSNIQK